MSDSPFLGDRSVHWECTLVGSGGECRHVKVMETTITLSSHGRAEDETEEGIFLADRVHDAASPKEINPKQPSEPA